MTEMLSNLDLMLEKLKDCTSTEISRTQAVPRLLQTAKALIEAAEQISRLETHCCSAENSECIAVGHQNIGNNLINRNQEEHANPRYYQILSNNLYKVRRSRDRVFNEDELFADPAWDILLDLMNAELTNRSVSVTSACIAACVPPTTALRWVSLLEARDYVERIPDTLDGRRRFLKLTVKARTLMNRFFLDLNRQHLI